MKRPCLSLFVITGSWAFCLKITFFWAFNGALGPGSILKIVTGSGQLNLISGAAGTNLNLVKMLVMRSARPALIS